MARLRRLPPAALVKNLVDAPLSAIDPALFALRDALPAPLSGGGNANEGGTGGGQAGSNTDK